MSPCRTGVSPDPHFPGLERARIGVGAEGLAWESYKLSHRILSGKFIKLNFEIIYINKQF